MRKKHIVIGLVLVAVLQLAVFSSSAFADGDVKGDIIKKAMLQGLSKCADKKNANFAFKDTINGTDVPSMQTAGFVLDASINGVFVVSSEIFKSINDHYPMPSNKGKGVFDYADYSVSAPYSTKDDMYSCANIVAGYGDAKGNKVSSIYQRTGKGVFNKTSSTSDKENWLVQYGGFEKSGGSSSSSGDSKTECFTFMAPIKYYSTADPSIAAIDGKEFPSQSYCVTLGSDDKATGGSITNSGTYSEFDYAFIYLLRDVQYFRYYPELPNFNGEEFIIPLVGKGGEDSADEHDYVRVSVKGRKADDIKADLRSALSKMIAALYDETTFPKPAEWTDIFGIKCTWPTTEDYAKGICQQDVYGGPKKTDWWATFSMGANTTVTDGEGTSSSTYDTSATYNFTDDPWKIVKALTGTSSTFDAQKAAYLTESEKIMLYELYLVDVLGAKVSCKTTNDEGGITFFNYGNTTADANCSVTYQGATNESFNGVKPVDIGASYGTGVYNIIYYAFAEDYDVTYAEIKDYLHNLSTSFVLDFPSIVKSEYYDTNMADIDELNEKERQLAEEQERTCYDSAGSANWIVCPIIDNGSSASTAMYGFIEKLLQTNTSIFRLDNKNDKASGENGTFVAWSKFRDYANIAFIIVFVVVILSQVTGMGIDNYGIKKILPKLILGALLVNISYFVCQIAVDSGNLIGGGVKGLFDNIIRGIGLDDMALKPAFDGFNAGKTAIVGTAAGILVAIIGAAWYFSGGGIVVPILLGVIGIVIGIIFLLVLLAVRQGLAVILTVASPLAFIAYMLPNTRSLFNRWLKLFSGTLLAYPICSAVVYGGQMVSNIIIVSSANGSGLVTNFALLLTAGILSIAPVFFIPTLITKSMSGIATVANGLKARATSLGKGAFDRSHTAENMRNVAGAQKERMNANRAQRTINRLKGRNNLSTAQRAQLRTAQNVKDSYLKKNSDLYGGMTKTMNKGALMDMGREAFSNEGFDAEKFDAAIAQLYATGNDEDAFKLIQEVSGRTRGMNTEQLEKFKTTLATRGGTIGKAYAKVLGKNSQPMSLEAALSGGQMADAFNGMGSNAVAGMTKDELSFLSGFDLNNMFTDEQLATAASTHTSGKAGSNFNRLLDATGQAGSMATNLSAEQWAKASQETLDKLSQIDPELNDRMARSIAESGDGQLMSSISGEVQKAALRRVNNAKAEAQSRAEAEKTRRELEARDSQQRFQQRMVRTMEQIRDNTQRPPETFNDGGGI